MKHRARRRLNPPRTEDQTPAWVGDPKEMVRRMPAFQALELCGALTREQREAGDIFAMRYALALEHCPSLVGSYGERAGGGSVSEEAQHASRLWVRHALKRSGPASNLLQCLARDERPLLTESCLRTLRQGLDAIRG